MVPVLQHVWEKLERAKEHSDQAQTEVEAFLEAGPGKRILNDDAKATRGFREFHANRPVPPRVSVLIGDALHQLRSSLDHLACALAMRDSGECGRHTQFPILLDDVDADTNLRRSYWRQMEGITRPAVQAAIKAVQPYHGATERHDTLRHLHQLDIEDKHRALIVNVVVVEERQRLFSAADAPIRVVIERRDTGAEPPESVPSLVAGQQLPIVKTERRLTACVVFRDWIDTLESGAYPVGVVRGLGRISMHVASIMTEFESLLS